MSGEHGEIAVCRREIVAAKAALQRNPGDCVGCARQGSNRLRIRFGNRVRRAQSESIPSEASGFQIPCKAASARKYNVDSCVLL